MESLKHNIGDVVLYELKNGKLQVSKIIKIKSSQDLSYKYGIIPIRIISKKHADIPIYVSEDKIYALDILF